MKLWLLCFFLFCGHSVAWANASTKDAPQRSPEAVSSSRPQAHSAREAPPHRVYRSKKLRIHKHDQLHPSGKNKRSRQYERKRPEIPASSEQP